ncbi:6339_t:CDS:2, partial [Scutellospora calospora]
DKKAQADNTPDFQFLYLLERGEGDEHGIMLAREVAKLEKVVEEANAKLGVDIETELDTKLDGETDILTMGNDGIINKGTASNLNQAKTQAKELKEIKGEFAKLKTANINNGGVALIGNDNKVNDGLITIIKANLTILNDYQNGFRQVLELNPIDPLPDNLNDLSDLYNSKSGTQTVIQLKTKADHYDRIHTKLNGKVSDSELDNLLNNSPSCSHTDYDAIKQERDQLKTDKDNHKCDCDSKAVITEIKQKINPPTDKISELEQQITKLQTPQSLKEIKVSEAVKKEIVEISKEFGLTSQQLASASSYQELATLQSQAFKSKLESEINDKKSARYLNCGLGVLCLGSLVALAWMLIKQSKGLKLGDNKE